MSNVSDHFQKNVQDLFKFVPAIPPHELIWLSSSRGRTYKHIHMYILKPSLFSFPTHSLVFLSISPTSFCLHLPLSLSLFSFSAPAAAAAAPVPEWRVPSPPCTGTDKRPDSPAEHCPIFLSVPSCTAVVVVVASGEKKSEAWTGTKIQD